MSDTHRLKSQPPRPTEDDPGVFTLAPKTDLILQTAL